MNKYLLDKFISLSLPCCIPKTFNYKALFICLSQGQQEWPLAPGLKPDIYVILNGLLNIIWKNQVVWRVFYYFTFRQIQRCANLYNIEYFVHS